MGPPVNNIILWTELQLPISTERESRYSGIASLHISVLKLIPTVALYAIKWGEQRFFKNVFNTFVGINPINYFKLFVSSVFIGRESAF